MVERVVDDVFDRCFVLVVRLDQLRPKASPEDVVAAAVPVVERACVLAVEVAHAVRQVRQRRLDDEVVVIAHQAARVQLPAVAGRDSVEDVNEGLPVGVVEHDRRLVVAACADVVVPAGDERTEFATHCVRR